MAHVEVVNRQVIDGEERKRGEVIEVSSRRARDLIRAGKANPAEGPAGDVAEGVGKGSPKLATATKEVAKNG